MGSSFRLSLASALLAVTGTANAVFIEFEAMDQGGGFWRYDYVIGQEETESYDVEEFTIFFDLSLYFQLELVGTPLNWDGLLAQPDVGLPDDGFADWLALDGGISPGSALGGFAVTFGWLGQGAPGVQAFDLIDPMTFDIRHSGTTVRAAAPPPIPVSEPATLALLGLGLAGLGLVRWRSHKPTFGAAF